MNPLTNVKNITKLNERELALGTKVSWHNQYKDSAWVFIGGLPFDLTEGDILSVFSQFGEIANINLIRDKKTGKSKGYTFLCYENQKSTILAVDNLNGIKIVGRTIRVDHVANYRAPKEREDEDELTKALRIEGCAPKTFEESNPKIVQLEDIPSKHHKKSSKKKKHKRDDKGHKRKHSHNNSSEESDSVEKVSIKIKKEKNDPGYEKYLNKRQRNSESSKHTKHRSKNHH